MALAFDPESPALRSCAGVKAWIRAGEMLPARVSTRSMIVAAALLESCCEMIDVANARKLLCFREGTPIGQMPERSMMGANRGSVATMARAIFRARLAVSGSLTGGA